jgi:TonB family protein
VRIEVQICKRSGQLAGPHCAAYGGPVTKRLLVSGQQPDGRCDVCKPPPPPPPAPDPVHLNRSAEAREPVLLRDANPDYPDHLREAGVEGTVTLAFTVDERGRVTDVSVSRSSGSRELDACAVRAIKRFRYKPAEQGGQPRPFRMSKPFAFRLDG